MRNEGSTQELNRADNSTAQDKLVPTNRTGTRQTRADANSQEKNSSLTRPALLLDCLLVRRDIDVVDEDLGVAGVAPQTGCPIHIGERIFMLDRTNWRVRSRHVAKPYPSRSPCRFHA